MLGLIEAIEAFDLTEWMEEWDEIERIEVFDDVERIEMSSTSSVATLGSSVLLNVWLWLGAVPSGASNAQSTTCYR